MNFVDITGQRFGKLTALEKLPKQEGVEAAVWRCRCDCGNETTAQGPSLRSGKKISCGCLRQKSYSDDRRCAFCGNPVHASYYRYCSRACAARARAGGIKVEMPVKELREGLYRCPHQTNVFCTDRDCIRCGWNPEVAAKRSEKILKKLRGAMV